MQKLIEFYEMVSLNDAALRGSEREAILEARRALQIFQQAMEGFKHGSTVVRTWPEATFPVAAYANNMLLELQPLG